MVSDYKITNKNEFVVFLQNMVKVLGNELTLTSHDIDAKNILISALEKSIKSITQQIVDLNTQIKYAEKLISDLKVSSEKEQSIMNSIRDEMNKLRYEADELRGKIDTQQRILDSLPWYLKGTAYSIRALIEAFTGDLRATINKIQDSEIRLSDMRSNFNQSIQKLTGLEDQMKRVDREKNDHIKQQDEKQIELERCAKEKTKQEDFKVNLGHFKSRIVSLLDTVNTNIDFSDDMLNTKDEIIAEIKSAYSKYNRPLPDDLLLSQSKIIELSSVYRVYKISSL